jgi:membrane associated rhomboid family serine protease
MLILPFRDHNPLKWIRFHYMNATMIGLCIAVHAWQLSLGDGGARAGLAFGVVPAVITGHAVLPPELAVIPAYLTLLTSAFLHANWLHLGGNMLFLWIFGDNIEDCLGHVRYLAFFALCAIAAALAHIAVDPSSTVPTIGASGAVSGMLGGYLILHPKARVWTLVAMRIPLPLPAVLVLVVWFALQLYGAADPDSTTSIAWWAHVGGFVTGAILVIPLRRKSVPLFDGMLSSQRDR